MSEDKPHPLKITIEITPEHWDHLTEDDVRRWVRDALAKAAVSSSDRYITDGCHPIAKVKRIKMVDGENKPELFAMHKEYRARSIAMAMLTIKAELERLL